MARYRNTFHQPGSSVYGPEYIETTSRPIEHRGHQIYHRIKSSNPSANCFDVVKDGRCIHMMAGLGGAKNIIDEEIGKETD